MKKTFTLLVFVLLAGSLLFPCQVSAQAPEKMSYQAVIRNAGDQLVTSQEIGVRVSILQNSIDGTVVYQEIYNPNPETNNNGLLTIEIGAGVPLTGTFSEIDWSDGPYFLETEIDPSGGTTYTISGTNQLLSVPYALYSGTAEILTGEINESQISDLQNYLITEADPVFEAWDRSAGIEITESQITDLQDYLTEETDPLFTGSPASGIEFDDIDNWNEAHNITSGTLTVNRGGTGRISLTSGKVLVGSGTSPVLMPASLHWDNANVRLGIGTSTPSERLHVNGANFGVTGTHGGSPAISITDGGTRMFFYPRKSAFRAGRVTGEEWNDANIGEYSTALGFNTIASGNYSTAMGSTTEASGDYSTAMGLNTTATTWYSTAMGYSTTASGLSSTAMGSNTEASGNASTAMGGSTEASGLRSTAMGHNTTASGDNSTATGSFTTASGFASTAMGRNANAVGNHSFAINLSSETGPDVLERYFRISGAAWIGGSRTWSSTSDKRLKKDIQYLGRENNLEKIMDLNGVRFKWEESSTGNDRYYLGFLAQDVLDILPEPVLHDEQNDIYTMEYSAIIPVLVEAIKEQQQQIENQQNQIEEMKENAREIARLKEENALLGSSLNELEQFKADFEFWKSTVQAYPGE